MRKIFLLALSCILIHGSIYSQQSSSEAAIRKILNEQVDAWNHGDIDKFMEGYWKNDSLMFIGKTGVTYGYEGALNNYKKSYPDKKAMGTLQFDIIEVKKLSGEYYWVLGKWALIRENDKPAGVYTLLFKKINNKWVIIADHSS